eukprot:g2216.t1
MLSRQLAARSAAGRATLLRLSRGLCTTNADSETSALLRQRIDDLSAELVKEKAQRLAASTERNISPANNYAVASTVPPDQPVRRVDAFTIDEIRRMIDEEGEVKVCRCFRSSTFPWCDGAHNAHNEATGDNAAPLVLKSTGADQRLGKVDVSALADRCGEEQERHAAGPRANNYGLPSTVPADGPVRRLDVADVDDVGAVVEEAGEVKVCRCWKSSTFPWCDGSHNGHNEATGDNCGPLVLTPAQAAAQFAAAGHEDREAEGAEGITMEEVAKHNTDDDLWIVVDGQVYDVTAFTQDHPGGSGFITKRAGEDATKAFTDAGHSPEAWRMLTDPDKEPRIKHVGALAAGEGGVDLSKVFNTTEMEEAAIAQLDPGALEYYKAGAEDNRTTAENERVWEDYLLRPRMFIDVSDVDMSTTVLAGSGSGSGSGAGDGRGGHTLELPMMAAPTALLKMAHDEGECAVARACARAGVGNCLSTTASMSIEEVAAASDGCYRWFQLYVYRDLEKTRSLVQRAEAAGYSAIVLTVDLPVLGNRTSLQKIGFKVPEQFKMANMEKEQATDDDQRAAEEEGVSVTDPGDRKAYIARLYSQNMSLDLIGWLGTITDLPVLIKGVLRGEDAARAAAYTNVRGLIVSNHGGRQLDGEIAPLSALPEVKRWIDVTNEQRAQMEPPVPPVELFVDGGVRRGRDVLKAVALGAKAVLVGRPVIWGLAAGGEDGVAKVWELLKEELKTCMQLAGVQSLDQVDRSFLVPRASAVTVGAWTEDQQVSAFDPIRTGPVAEPNPLLEQAKADADATAASQRASAGRANNYAVASTVPPDQPVRRVDAFTIDEIRRMIDEEGEVKVCRCFRSSTFPWCDGAHNAHNEATGDNAAPLVLKSMGADQRLGKVDVSALADRCGEEQERHAAGPRANNYGLPSTVPADGPVRRLDVADVDDVGAVVEEAGEVKVCRCWKSSTFPWCDGSHNGHNEATGDNCGPLVLTPPTHHMGGTNNNS